MNLAYQMVFWVPLVLTVAVLLWLWRASLIRPEIEIKKLKNAFILVVGIYVLQVLARLGFLYYYLKESAIGPYLMPGMGTNFFAEQVWQTVEPFILAMAVGLVLVLIALLVKRLLPNRPWFTTTDFFIIFLTSFVVGYPGVFVLLIGALLLMIIFIIIQSLIIKTPLSGQRMPMAPFLLLMAILHLVLFNFSFYQNFLVTIHLI